MTLAAINRAHRSWPGYTGKANGKLAVFNQELREATAVRARAEELIAQGVLAADAWRRAYEERGRAQ